jgi:hypothetical protein
MAGGGVRDAVTKEVLRKVGIGFLEVIAGI